MKFKKNYLSGEELDKFSTFNIDAIRPGYIQGIYGDSSKSYVYNVSEYFVGKIGGLLDKVFDKIGLNTFFKYVIGDETNTLEPTYAYQEAYPR